MHQQVKLQFFCISKEYFGLPVSGELDEKIACPLISIMLNMDLSQAAIRQLRVTKNKHVF